MAGPGRGRNMVTIRAVIVGCGSMAKGWIKALQNAPELKDAVEIVGLVDLNLAAAKSLHSEFALSNAVIGTNLETVLRDTKPNLLFDITVPTARLKCVLTGLAHGCHVLTEKPMAESLDDARKMIAAAEAAGRVYAVVQNRRYIEGIRRIRQTIESGVLGKLTALHADFFIGAHFGGFREQMQNVLLLDMSIHTLDAARFIAGTDPVAVYAQESNPVGSWFAHGACANAIFEFSDDVIFTYRGSWVAEGAHTSWESTWRIIGTNGTLLWDGADKFEAHIIADNSGFHRPLRDVVVPPASHPSQTHGHASVIAEFLKAVETGNAPETAGNDNIKSLAMVLAAIESGHTQQRIKIAI